MMKDRIKNSYNLTYSKEKPNACDIIVNNFPCHRNEALIYLASNISGKRVLEIGCGNGRVLYTLRNNFKALYGMEISDIRAKAAAETLAGLNANIIEASIEEDLKYEDNFFDLVIWADVIEHVIDLWKAMENIKRITAKGGILITTTPNVAKIKGRIRFLFGKFPSTSGKDEGFAIRDNEMFDGGHLHYFTFSMLRKLYHKYDFKPIRLIGFGRFGALHNIYPELLSSSVAIVGQKI